ncbi:uncharacterized protein METZ01_LOCUS270992, partial [marine metagenome]
NQICVFIVDLVQVVMVRKMSFRLCH